MQLCHNEFITLYFEISIFPNINYLESLFIIYLSPYSQCGHKRIIATMNRGNTTK